MAAPCKVIISPKLAKVLNLEPNKEIDYNNWVRILHDGGLDTLVNDEIVSLKGIKPQPKAVKKTPQQLAEIKKGWAKFKPATSVEGAVERIESSLESSGIKVQVIENEEEYNKEAQKRGGGAGTEGMFISKDGGTIYLNKAKLKGGWGTTIVWHEATHPIINIIRNTNPELFNKILSGAKRLKADGGLQNALKFAEKYREGMSIKENAVGKFDLYDGDNLIGTFDTEQNAQNYIEAVVADEFIVEAIARIVDGKIKIEQLPTSLRQSIIDFINSALAMLNIKGRISPTDIQQFKNLAAQVSEVLQSGKDISEIVGAENVKEFQNKFNLKNEDGSDFNQFRISNKFKNLINGIKFEYLANSKEFQDLIKNEKITNDKTLKDFDGVYVMLHVPDNAFTGVMYKDGEILVEGKGGVYFPIRFNKEGYFWASTEAGVDKLVDVLNRTRAANKDGKIRLALISSRAEKIMSSSNASNSMIDVLFSKAFDKRAKLNQNQVKEAIINASKRIQEIFQSEYDNEIKSLEEKLSSAKDEKERKRAEKNLKTRKTKGVTKAPSFKNGANLNAYKSILANFYSVDNSSFDERKLYNEFILTNIADLINKEDDKINEGNKKKEREIAEEILTFLGQGKESIKLKATGGRLSKNNLMAGFSDLLGEPTLKGEDSNNIYAILEIDSDVEKVHIEDEHGSYPFAVKGKEGSNIVLHMLQDRQNWKDNVLDPETNELITKEREKQILPTTAGITFNPVQISSKEVKATPQASKGQREELKDVKSTEKALEKIINPEFKETIVNKLSAFDERIKNKNFPSALEVAESVLPRAIFNKYKSLYEIAARNSINVSNETLPYGMTAAWAYGNIQLNKNVAKYYLEDYNEFAETLNHEIIHGLISRGIRDNYALNNDLQSVMDSILGNYDNASDEVKNIISYIQDTRKEFTEKDIFGATEEELKSDKLKEVGSLEELITYAFTNKEFADFLDSIPATKEIKANGNSIFDQLKNILRNFIGKISKSPTALDEINSVLNKYFDTSWNEKDIAERNQKYEWGKRFEANKDIFDNYNNDPKSIAEAYHNGNDLELNKAIDKIFAAPSAQFSKGERNTELENFVSELLNDFTPEEVSQQAQEELGYTKEQADNLVNSVLAQKEAQKETQTEQEPQPSFEPTSKGREKERSFTVKQFLADPSIPQEVKEAVSEDAIYYNELPNTVSVETANKIYDLLGQDDALQALLDDNNGMSPAIRIVLGQVIIRRARLDGGAEAEARVVRKAEEYIAKKGTEYGQAIQAFSLFQWMSPEGQIMYAKKQRQAEIDAQIKKNKESIKKKKAAIKKANEEAIDEVLEGAAGQVVDESAKAKPKESKKPKSYGENNKIVTKARYNEIKKALKGKLFSGLAPELIELGLYHIEAGSRKFSDFYESLVDDLGSGIKKYVQGMYDAAKAEFIKKGGDISELSDDNDIQDVINQKEAEKLAGFIVGRAKTKSPSIDPAKQIVSTLLGKVSEKLGTTSAAKMNDIEKIALAIKNREQYADVWEKSKEIVKAKIDELDISEDEKEQMKQALESYFNEMIGQPFSDRMLKSAVKKAIKDLNVDIKDVIRRHYTVGDSTKRTLVEKLIMDANLSGEDARYLAARVEKEFNAIATEKKKDALDALKTVKEKLPQNAKKTKQLEDKLIELSNLGAFSDEEFLRSYADAMGWKQISQEEINQIKKLAEIVEKEQDGFRRARAVEDLLAYQSKLKGTSIADLSLSIWYANVLSGYKTQEVNIVSNAIGLGFNYVISSIRNPRDMKQLAKAMMRGFNRGYLEGAATLTTGYSPIRGKVEVPTALELTQFKGKYNPANAWKYVTRFMKAADVVFFEAAKEMRAYQYAKKLAIAENVDEPNAIQTQKALEIVGQTKEKLAEAKAQALQEFKDRVSAINADNSLSIKEKQSAVEQERKDVKRRIFEILEQGRTKTEADFISKTEDYARRVTFNYKPEGILGSIAQAINYMTSKFTPLKLVVPFTNIIANVANESLNYTPVGFLRGATEKGSLGEALSRKLGLGSVKGNEKFDEDHRADMIIKASMGVMLTGLVYALSQSGGDDDEPIIEITADGYGNYKDNYSLKNTGWQPYSIKVGNKWYSYQYTPLLPMFTIIGKMNDVEKYREEKLKDTDLTKVSVAMGTAMKSFFDNTYLASLNAVLSTIFDSQSDSMIESGMNSLMKTLTSFVLPNLYTQAAKDIESIMDIPTKEIGDEFYATALKEVPFLRDRYYAKVDALGEEIIPDTDKFVSSVVPASKQSKTTTNDLWILLAKNKTALRTESFRQFNNQGVYDPKKDEIRVISRKEYYEYTKKKGSVIKEFMLDNYEQLSELNEKDFKYIMEGVKSKAAEIAKMSLFPDEFRVPYEESKLMKTRIKQKIYERDKEKKHK